MTAEEQARPVDVFTIMPTERPDLQAAGFKLAQDTASSAYTVTTTRADMPNLSVTFTGNGPESIVEIRAGIPLDVASSQDARRWHRPADRRHQAHRLPHRR